MEEELPHIVVIPVRCCHTPRRISNITGVISKLIGWYPKIHWGPSMMGYFSGGEISFAILPGCKKSKRFSPGSDFTEQSFTGELSGVDSARLLRQDVNNIIFRVYSIIFLFLNNHTFQTKQRYSIWVFKKITAGL